MSDWSMKWILWGAMFVLVEGQAIVSKEPGATLSAHIRKLFATKDKSWGWLGRRAGLIAFLVWQGLHYFGVWIF